jgi:hypothetical protein
MCRNRVPITCYMCSRGWLQPATRLEISSLAVTPEQFAVFVQHLPNLKHLILGNLDDSDIFDALERFPVASETRFVPQVESISLYRCTLSNEMIISAVECFPKLQQLDLNKSYFVAWETLDWVSQYVQHIYHYTNSDDWSPHWSDKKKEYWFDKDTDFDW